MVGASKSLWMVRNQGKILGPYPIDQLVDLIHEREITTLDEILTPGSRWKTVREVPEVFSRVQQSYRQSPQKEQQTQTDTLANQTLSQTAEMIESTVVGRIIPRSGPESPIIREVKPISSPSNDTGTTKNFGYAQDPYISKRVSGYAGQIFWILIILVLGIAGYSIYSSKVKVSDPIFVKRMTYDQLIEQAVKCKLQGEWACAQKFLNEALIQKPQAFEASLYLSEIMVQDRTQSVQARRMFNELLATHFDEETAKVAHTGLGTLSLYDNQLQEAQDHFQAALQVDSGFIPAQFNRAMVFFLRKEYSEAQKIFVKISSNGFPLAHLMLAHCWSQLADQKPAQRNELIERARGSLEPIIKNAGDFSFEAQFLDLALQLKTGASSFEKAIEVWLKMDSGLTRRHVHSPLLYMDFLKWEYSLIACHDLSLKTNSDGVKLSMLAVCYDQAGQRGKAQSYFDQAVKAGGSYYSLPHQIVSLLSDSDQRANALLKEASSQKSWVDSQLMSYLLGKRGVELKDFTQVQSSLDQLTDKQFYKIQAQELRLESLALKSNTKEFNELLKMQLELNPTYRPFISLERNK